MKPIDYRGVRDAFAPPDARSEAVALARGGPTAASAAAPKTPLLEDDGDSWAAVPSDGAAKSSSGGSLVVVDTGVVAVNQVTVEGHRWIQQSERVLFLGGDPVTERWLLLLNENVESLDRLETADEIVERMLDHIRAGLAVCLAYHGRSELTAQVLGDALAVCRGENLPVHIVPGVSALDCLFSDLGLNPLNDGCQIFDARHFIERRRRPDPSAALILSLSEDTDGPDLLEVLRAEYGAEHEAVIYEPARYAVLEPLIRRSQIGKIGEADLAGVSNLYIPPKDSNG